MTRNCSWRRIFRTPRSPPHRATIGSKLFYGPKSITCANSVRPTFTAKSPDPHRREYYTQIVKPGSNRRQPEIRATHWSDNYIRWAQGVEPDGCDVDTYLNEFVFRYNRRFYRHVSFEALLGLAAHHAPASHWDIVNQVNPRKGARTIRLAPRRRKTATGIRQDDVTPTLHATQDHHVKPVDPLYVDEPGTAG